MLVHRFVMLSAKVREYDEQFVVHTLVDASEAYVPFGHVRTQKRRLVSAYDIGSDGHVGTHF